MHRLREAAEKYGCPFAALLIFLLILAGVWGGRKSGKETCEVVCFGDSIVGNERDDTSITALMEQSLGVHVYNGAFGGSTMACLNREDRASVTSDTLSMARLSEAVAQQDFYVQNAGVTACAAMEYFPEAVYGFQKIDFDRVDVLVIEHGVNDYLAGVPLENEEDPYDVYTFGGALRYALKNLTESYSEKRILVATPTYCWYLLRNLDCETFNSGFGVLEDYVNLEMEIASEFNVEVLDNYHESGIGPGETFEAWQTYTQDGVHLNEAGRRIVARRIAERIAEGAE